MTKNELEPEVLRGYRIRNYRIKESQNFTCAEDGCDANEKLLVAGHAAYCPVHMGKRAATPGQWDETKHEPTGGKA